jgi:membrane-associated phospholipid phosphatase
MDFDWTAFEYAVTNLGNLAVVGPVAVLVWAWLLWRRGLWAALRYQWPVAAAFAVTLGLKLVSRAVGGAMQDTPFELSDAAPSGHMAMGTVVYGGVALMLLRRGPEPVSLLTALLVSAMLAGIGVTRVILGAHTPADVLAGLLIGGACALWVGLVAEVPPRESVREAAELVLLVSAAVAMVCLSWLHFDSGAVL